LVPSGTAKGTKVHISRYTYRRLVGSEAPLNLIATYHPEAADELDAEVEWYEDRLDGLGARFITNVDTVVDYLLDCT